MFTNAAGHAGHHITLVSPAVRCTFHRDMRRRMGVAPSPLPGPLAQSAGIALLRQQTNCLPLTSWNVGYRLAAPQLCRRNKLSDDTEVEFRVWSLFAVVAP